MVAVPETPANRIHETTTERILPTQNTTIPNSNGSVAFCKG